MRNYPRDSPQAAARIIALALIADGHVSRTELDTLDCCHAREQLGIEPEALQEVARALCEDLLATSTGDWTTACVPDAATLDLVLDEITEPMLRLKVLQLCLAAVAADGHVAPGESSILRAAATRWGVSASPAGAGRKAA